MQDDNDQVRSELIELLLDVLRGRFPELTDSQAAEIVNLWVLKRDVLTRDVEGDIFASFQLGDDLRKLRQNIDQLDPRLSAIFKEEPSLIYAAGLASHRGWYGKNTRIRQRKANKPRACGARMMQWAVGQGGFWTTSGKYRAARKSERSFEIVFDCGSSTVGALAHALRDYRPARGVIDYLFLSHLDRDHTSGVDELLRKHRIDTVVMPLLTPAAALLASARLAAQDGLTDIEAELLTDPGTYLGRRGVQRVILVQSAPEDGGPESPRAPLPTQPPRQPLESDWTGSPPDIIDPGRGRAIFDKCVPHVEIVSHAVTFWLVGPDGRAFWQLAPYVHPFDPLRIGRFMQSAYQLLDAAGGSASTASRLAALKNIVQSPAGLGTLKRLYKQVRCDHNCLSMSLFSCPCPIRRPRMSIRLSGAKETKLKVRPDSPRFGWLHTGDSALARESYRRAWLNYYEDVLNHVAVLAAPHHGSRHNFHRDIFFIPKPAVALACAAHRNSYGHPAAVVGRSAKASGSIYQQVDEQPKSAVAGLYIDR